MSHRKKSLSPRKKSMKKSLRKAKKKTSTRKYSTKLQVRSPLRLLSKSQSSPLRSFAFLRRPSILQNIEKPTMKPDFEPREYISTDQALRNAGVYFSSLSPEQKTGVDILIGNAERTSLSQKYSKDQITHAALQAVVESTSNVKRMKLFVKNLEENLLSLPQVSRTQNEYST